MIPLFRAWDKTRERHYMVHTLEFDIHGNMMGGCMHEWGDNIELTFTAEDVVIEQFTGVIDKKGRKIFNGDIVMCNNKHVGVVEWEEHDCCFNVSGYYNPSNDYPTIAFMEGQPFEVVGNIHDNLDLLP